MTALGRSETALRSPPTWFVLFARLLPIAILGQFLTAGLGLFFDSAALGLHGMLGTTLSLPVLALVVGTAAIRDLRPLARWMAPILVLYLVQIALAAGGSGLPLALHPGNGGLLFGASLLFWSKVESTRKDRDAARVG